MFPFPIQKRVKPLYTLVFYVLLLPFFSGCENKESSPPQTTLGGDTSPQSTQAPSPESSPYPPPNRSPLLTDVTSHGEQAIVSVLDKKKDKLCMGISIGKQIVLTNTSCAQKTKGGFVEPFQNPQKLIKQESQLLSNFNLDKNYGTLITQAGSDADFALIFLEEEVRHFYPLNFVNIEENQNFLRREFTKMELGGSLPLTQFIVVQKDNSLKKLTGIPWKSPSWSTTDPTKHEQILGKHRNDFCSEHSGAPVFVSGTNNSLIFIGIISRPYEYEGRWCGKSDGTLFSFIHNLPLSLRTRLETPQ